MYRATLTHTYEYKGTAPDNIKVQKERLSFLFYANMSGSDKMKPVVKMKPASLRTRAASKILIKQICQYTIGPTIKHE